MENNHTQATREPCPSRSQVGHFARTLATVRGQIQSTAFGYREKRQAEEIAKIITEVYLLPPTAEIQIDGNKLSAGFVAEVYSNLTHDNIISVIAHFNACDYEIRFVKTYLRTALYNSVFEIESRAKNESQAEFFGA